MPCYGDDSTVVVSSKNPEDNKQKLKDKLDNISDFLQNNGLVINQSKTKTQNYMVRQKRTRVYCDPVVMTIQSANETKDICNKKFARIMGLNLQQDKPLLQALRRRLGALKHLGNNIPRMGRLTLSNGLIMSKLSYMITVWGGTQRVNMRKVQQIMNATARYVQNGGRNWSTYRLMESCNWLTAI